ncbi:MAG: CDP-alcohol phosphatidyltransferase family protein, partial [Pseudomonadota bacterium]
LGAAAILALDGVDGWIARKQDRCSAFGARYDMEVDAALMLAIGLLVSGLGDVGAWALLIGAWRYAFLALGAVAPRFARPLAPSLRRKIACAVPLFALTAVVAPIWPPGAAGLIVGAALALVSLSFLIDITRLARR